MSTTTAFFLLLYALIVGFGFYIRSYLIKKGEDLATKEDFKDLRSQTAELRRATKEIETKIDDQIWNRQRQWEMKKEIFLEAARAVAEADAALATTVSAYLRRETLGERINQCEQLWFALAAHGSEIMIVSKMNTITVYTNMTKSFIDTVLCLNPREDSQTMATEKFDKFRSMRAAFYVVLRKELGIELTYPSATTQSGGSSAEPGPD
jgi:hypothetical protein